LGKEGRCFWTDDGETGAIVGDVGEFYVVHDDEAVEEGEEVGDLCGGGFEEKGVWCCEDVGVALNAALNAEEEVVVPLAGLELLDGVGDHAVEPADAVFASDADPAGGLDGRDSGSVE